MYVKVIRALCEALSENCTILGNLRVIMVKALPSYCNLLAIVRSWPWLATKRFLERPARC